MELAAIFGKILGSSVTVLLATLLAAAVIAMGSFHAPSCSHDGVVG